MSMPEKQTVAVTVDGHRLQVSNLDKVMYPATETTKGEVLNYYARIAPVMLPLLADRPVTRIRWPHGVAGPSFFEKNLPGGAPSWLRTVTVSSSGSRGGGDTIRYPVVEDTAGLTYLVNLASLELHVPQWRFDADGQPLPPGKVLLDWSQNTAAKTTICPWSMRGRETPTVAAPRTWAEVEKGAQDRDALRQLDIDEVLARVARDGDVFTAQLAG